MKHHSGPCLEKKCSWCCNPVKVQKDFPEEKIPTDTKGNRIWIERDETFVPKSHPETIKLKTYDCMNFDRETGKCKDYTNRPEICRNTSCIDEKLEVDIDMQHQKATNEEFMSLKRLSKK